MPELLNSSAVATKINDNTFAQKGNPTSGAAFVEVASSSAVSGVISTQNLVPAGVATANSAVEIPLNSESLLAIQTVGTYTGALTVQATIDGVNWVSLGGVPIVNLNTGGNLATITSALQSVFQVDVGGFLKARVTGLAAMTGSVTVTLKAALSSALVALDSPLPAGSNAIGIITSVTTSGTPLAPATPYFINSAASTNGALILTGTSGLQAFFATNTGAAVAFVKLYNKATAPTVGTDVPEMIIPVPAAVAGVPGVANLAIGHSGFRFALGLGIAITGLVADTDTTAVAAGQVKVKLSRTV